MIVFFNLHEPTSIHVLRVNEDSFTTELAGMLALHEGQWRFAKFSREGTEPVVHNYPTDIDLLSVLQLVQEAVCSG